MAGQIIHLLWTGGWDSTFRLLDLVLEKKITVQPYYIVDTNRRSLRNELVAIRTIKNVLNREFSYTKELILPTNFIQEGDIRLPQEIIAAYKAIQEENAIGDQYIWFPSICLDQDQLDFEICIESGKPESALSLVLEPCLELVDSVSGPTYRIKKEYHNQPEGILFNCFSFPLYKMSKLSMKKTAEEKGWLNNMKLTWSCHMPVLGLLPCGICTPCKDVFEDKMGWRYPAYLRFLDKTKVLYMLRIMRKKVVRKKHQ